MKREMEKRTSRPSITPEEIYRRKFELLKRDPLAQELDALYRRYRFGKLRLVERERIEGKLLELEQFIREKWNCSFIPNKNNRSPVPLPQFLYWLVIDAGHPSVFDARGWIKDRIFYRLKNMGPFERELLEKKQGWLFFPGTGAFEMPDEGDRFGTPYIPVPPWSIPLLIDIGGLTDKDKTVLLEQVWAILKPTIGKRKAKSGRWKAPPQIGDPPQLAFLYKLPENEFKDYLRWYDQHMQNTPGRPSEKRFRNIAASEFLKEYSPDKADEAMEKIAQREKVIRLGSKQKVIHGYIGEHLKKEDKIGHAVKVIYEAIYRQPYPVKKSRRQEKYNCPDHGGQCPESCKYLEGYIRDFNRRCVLKPLRTTQDDLTPKLPIGKKKMSSDRQFDEDDSQ